MRSFLLAITLFGAAAHGMHVGQFPMYNMGGYPQQMSPMFPMGNTGNMGMPQGMPQMQALPDMAANMANMGMGMGMPQGMPQGMGMPQMQALPDVNPQQWMGQGFGQGFGQMPLMANPSDATPANVATPPTPQKDYLWFCLEDIFPREIQAAAGIPPKIGHLMSSYATHAYVLLGPSPQQSMAWQVQLNEGMQYWAKVLMESMQMDTEHPVEWGLKKAEMVTGTTKMSSVPGDFVFKHSKKCFKSAQPATCTGSDIQSFAIDYTNKHPRFNLAHTNCALFACHVVQHCSVPTPEGCDPFQCMNTTATKIMAEKEPGCGMEPVVDRTNQNPQAAAGFTFGIGVEQSTDQLLLQDMFPMHSAEAMKMVEDMVAEEKAAKAH